MTDDNHAVVGSCLGMEGAVSVERGETVLNGLPANAAIREKDCVRCHGAASASMEFSDGGRLYLGSGTVCRFDEFVFDRNLDTVTCSLRISAGAFVFCASAAAARSDDVKITVGNTVVHVQAARIGYVQFDDSSDFSVLLPSNDESLCGQVMVASTTGVCTLAGAGECVRIMTESGLLTEPISMPSSIVLDAFARSGLEPVLESFGRNQSLTEPISTGGFDVGAASIEPFHALNDRLFERRFVPGQLYPEEVGRHNERQSDLLEDAFDGQRFVVKSEN